MPCNVSCIRYFLALALALVLALERAFVSPCLNGIALFIDGLEYNAIDVINQLSPRFHLTIVQVADSSERFQNYSSELL